MPRKKKSPELKQYTREIGERLKYARTRRTLNFQPLTREELAYRTGISVRTIEAYERGTIAPGIYPLKLLIRELKVRTDWMLYGDKRKKR